MPAPVSPGLRHERNERGASATEYALLVTGIAAVIVLAVVLFGGKVAELFNDSCDTIYSTSCQP